MLSMQACWTAAMAKKKNLDNQLCTENNILYKHGIVTKD